MNKCLQRILLACALIMPCTAYTRTPLLILETEGKHATSYRNLLLMAESVGFDVTYQNFYDFLESPKIDQYDTLLFLPGVEFFKNIKHELAQNFIAKITTWSADGSKNLGVLLPATSSYSPTLATFADALLRKFGVSAQSFVQLMLQADLTIGQHFGTSLFGKKETPYPDYTPEAEGIHLLPRMTTTLSPAAQRLAPYGLATHNPTTNTIFFISSATKFTFADIEENYFANPHKLKDRHELLTAAHQTLFEWHEICKTRTLAPENKQKPPLPQELTSAYTAARKQQVRTHNTPHINAAWLDYEDYHLYQDKAVQALRKTDPAQARHIIDAARKRGINFLFDANINVAWFEFMPEIFFHPNGVKKDELEKHLGYIRAIARELKNVAQERNKQLPRIYIGTDITLNFRRNKVHTPVQTVYGRTYDKIPSPFDFEHLWKSELLEPFEKFCTALQDELPIDGIFFDLEMYHAQKQAATYNDLMDFSAAAWHAYRKHTPAAPATSTVAQRVAYLREHKKFTNYFTVLQKESRAIALRIKKRLREIVPDIKFGAYAPTLLNSWFYRGFLAGLSSPTEPLLLATFNTDYFSHHDWLTANDIHILHGTALMLSKLATPSDFTLIDDLLKHHDFIWFNRATRPIYEYDQAEINKHYWAIEATALPADELATGITEHTSP